MSSCLSIKEVGTKEMKKPAMCSWAVRIGLGLLAWSVLLSGLVGVGMAGGPTEPTVASKERGNENVS